MKRLLTLSAILVLLIIAGWQAGTAPVNAQVIPPRDPIITSVDSSGTITVVRRFSDGSKVQLAQTDSLADAQKAWLDGVSKILQGK